jgi:hypothetical protein
VTVAALASRGFDTSKIQRLYPNVRPIAFAEAVDLEKQLAANLLAAA